MNKENDRSFSSEEEMYIEFVNSYRKNMPRLLSVHNYAFHKALFDLSLHGMGVLNWQNNAISGETNFLKCVLQANNNPIVIDVGANVGKYSKTAKEINPGAVIYSFEPHPKTFTHLQKMADEIDLNVFNLGMSDKEGAINIYDYADNNGSSHASLYQDVIEKNFGKPSIATEIKITTLDKFILEQGIAKVDLLKIDTEGHELNVLKGAFESIKRDIFEVVHIEFNEMNVYSRTFLRDIADLFPSHLFFRMLPDGLAFMGKYRPLTHELFAFQNIAIIKQDSQILSTFKIAE